jgi:hypothetical protein
MYCCRSLYVPAFQDAVGRRPLNKSQVIVGYGGGSRQLTVRAVKADTHG